MELDNYRSLLETDLSAAGLISCLPAGNLLMVNGRRASVGARVEKSKEYIAELESRRQGLLAELDEWKTSPPSSGDIATWKIAAEDVFNRLVQEYGARKALDTLLLSKPRPSHSFSPYIQLLCQHGAEHYAEALYRHLAMVRDGFDTGTVVYVRADNLPTADAMAHSENMLSSLVEIDGKHYAGASMCQLGQTGYMETLSQLIPRSHWRGKLIREPRESSMTGRTNVGRIMGVKGQGDMVVLDMVTAVPYEYSAVTSGIEKLLESFPHFASLTATAPGARKWSRADFDRHYDSVAAQQSVSRSQAETVLPAVLPFRWLRVPYGVDVWGALQCYEDRFPQAISSHEHQAVRLAIAQEASHYNPKAKDAYFKLSGQEDWLEAADRLEREGACELVLPTGDAVVVLKTEGDHPYCIAGASSELWPQYSFRTADGALSCLFEGLGAKPSLKAGVSHTQDPEPSGDKPQGLDGVVYDFERSSDHELIVYGFRPELGRAEDFIGCKVAAPDGEKQWFCISRDEVKLITTAQAEEFFKKLDGSFQNVMTTVYRDVKPSARPKPASMGV